MNARFRKMMLDMILIVLEASFVVFDDIIWFCKIGVPTGLSASVVLASLYLISFDIDKIELLGDVIGFYCRYINDIFTVEDDGDFDIIHVLNSWHSNIQVECTGESSICSGEVLYLDLCFRVDP